MASDGLLDFQIEGVEETLEGLEVLTSLSFIELTFIIYQQMLAQKTKPLTFTHKNKLLELKKKWLI